ncbi:chitobiosyldiphosphodolichol beta-mannosyltransferase [Raphidocelis subcapitata]|uniref:Chitobiosyldiphosphodolichol beta-mannosyltransferase n=1 Tax=Raphidocelis subcapitata TaxID=307507 RepID=A0A2V0NWX2_9CHLO|nr:chitobiosyldiphosphodolichol beta-mannosyltransferase [Raphidocelis subcapitata]|eukprot:GBF89437.1 chitobiosyldiphosphodolichol beta-mannosyltransferase [Raphidocelis subcapitata]
MAAPARVWVVVLGDFGRSPRMQYHAASLAAAGYDVHVLASPGSPPIRQLLDAPNVTLHHLPPPPGWAGRLPALPALAAKALLQAALMLWAALVTMPRPACILMQNPPAIPAMMVLALAALRHRAALVIDWHNLAYSVLALRHARRRWLVSLARAYERALGRRGAAHFTVTEAMAGFLSREFGVAAAVLYDRPPAAFRTLGGGERRGVLERLAPQLRAAAIGADVFGGGGGGGGAAAAAAAAAAPPSSSPLTRAAAARASAAAGAAEPFTRPPGGAGAGRRVALVVSSTSWTPDEDFGILLEAAKAYDAAAAADEALPRVLFAITGRGPQREEYLAAAARLPLRRCAFASVWLEPEDYPALLGAADLGVCLHTSSSGLDLPMKVVDMFGSGLPVLAARYPCIGELVKDGETGLLFDGPGQLSRQLLSLLRGFGDEGGGGGGGGGALARMRAAVVAAHDGWRWDENWGRVAAPVVAAACARRGK